MDSLTLISNIDIVCVDDGSPDDSISILREYEKKYKNIHVIRQQNGGVSNARNTGIAYVTENCHDDDYIVFLDGDDLWTKDCFNPSVAQSWEGVDCVGFSTYRCSNDLSRCQQPPKLTEVTQSGGSSSVWCHGSSSVNALLLRCGFVRRYQLRFNETLRYSEDNLFKFTCLFLAERIKIINKPMYCYRTNPHSAIQNRKKGIVYMEPIIDSYIKTGFEMEQYETPGRGSAAFYRVLAAVFTLEMIEEHFASFQSRKKLNVYFADHPDVYENFVKTLPSDLALEARNRRDLFLKHPSTFQLRCIWQGIFQGIQKGIRSNKMLESVLNNKRFPCKNTYI